MGEGGGGDTKIAPAYFQQKNILNQVLCDCDVIKTSLWYNVKWRATE